MSDLGEKAPLRHQQNAHCVCVLHQRCDSLCVHFLQRAPAPAAATTAPARGPMSTARTTASRASRSSFPSRRLFCAKPMLPLCSVCIFSARSHAQALVCSNMAGNEMKRVYRRTLDALTTLDTLCVDAEPHMQPLAFLPENLCSVDWGWHCLFSVFLFFFDVLPIAGGSTALAAATCAAT